MIRFEKIDENTKNLEEIKQLYWDAFPFEERIPFYIMVLVGNGKGVEFLSIYDDDTWLGFIHTLVGDELSYIFYFAIDNRLRQSGYGSKILHEYKKIHPRLSLAIEPIEENSDNIKQRRKRLEFYKKNGFETLDTKVVEMGIEFELMGAKGMKIKESDYKKLVKKFFDSFDQGRVLSVKEMRDADSYTIANFIDSKELMYRAGEAIFYVANWDIGDKVLILAGSGSSDAIVTVVGMFVGAALAHNFSLAGAPASAATAEKAASAGGPGINGQIFVIASIIILLIIAFIGIKKKEQ